MNSQTVDHHNPLYYSIGTRLRLPHFLAAVKSLPPTAVCLDLGSGTGFFSDFLTRRGLTVYAVDPDEQSLKKGRELYAGEKIDFIRGVAEQIPLAENSADFFVCSEVLEHVVDLNQSLSELRRVSKSGASFFLTVPAQGIFGEFFLQIGHHEGNEFERHSHPLFKKAAVAKQLADAGFRVKKIFYSKFIIAEVFMGLTKIAHNLKKKQEISGQHDILMPPLIYKILFPIVYYLCRLEDWLFRYSGLPGHMIIVSGKVEK